jgi:DNA-binding protein YbaB
MVQGLPTADSLLPSLTTLKRKLAEEESGFRGSIKVLASSDGRVTATANGMVEMLTVQIVDSAWPPADQAAITSLAASVKDACMKVLAQANADTKTLASAAAVGYTLAGIPNLGQTAPATPGFSSTETDITGRLRAEDPIIAAKQFQGVVGAVNAVVDGLLNVVTLTFVGTLPTARAVLENDVVGALNIALEKAKNVFEDGVRDQVDTGKFPIRPGRCLLVVGATSPLDSADAALQTRLQSMGMTVVLKTSASLATADAAGMGLAIITQTAVATQVGTKLRDVTTPVMVANQTLFDEMKMTGATTTDQGTANDKQVDILLPNHPLAAGLSGRVDVRTAANTLVWGKPSSSAIAVASLPGQPTKLVIFAYEKAAQMVGLAAPARRVAWFGNRPSPTTLTDAAWALFEAAVRWLNLPNMALDTVTFPEICVYASGNLQVADRVKVKRQDGTFAPIANNGTLETNVGVEAQVGDVWSKANVVLRGTTVNGFLKTAKTLTRQNQTVITGPITEFANIQVPSLTLTTTFPGSNQGNKTAAPNGTLTLAPGAYADVLINAGATLFLSGGTYHINNLTIEPGAKISCTSQTTQVTVYVKLGFTFRGSIIEKNSTARPKFFLGCFGTAPVPIEGPFTGTLAAPNATVTLGTVTGPGHTGAFAAKNLTVNPDNTIVHFPFSGTPSLGS